MNGECRHQRTGTLRGPFGQYEAKTVCVDCLRFLGWVSPSQEASRRKDRLDTLHLLLKGELSEWERSFLTSLEKSTYDLLTEKQEAAYQKILQKYGFTGEVKGQKIIATHQELMDTF